MLEVFKTEQGRVPVKLWVSNLEQTARTQLENLSSLPFMFKHVAVMPDAHAGKGSTVGTVIASKGAIIPAAIGVDIGCGMCAIQLQFKTSQLPTSLSNLRTQIESKVPTGFNQHTSESKDAIAGFQSLGFTRKTLNLDKALHQLGTLGGGNHFIEVCQDLEQNVWIMLHSGSRNAGKTLAEQHIEKAKDLMRDYFISLPDPDLAYLAQGTLEFESYIHDLLWAQQYAKINRELMRKVVLREVVQAIVGEVDDPEKYVVKNVDCHHNFTQLENHFGQNVWITRKGAVSARQGQLGIIPGSMGAKSFIVEGLGNADSFCSCSHGAGRKMSRTEAKKMFSLADLAAQTNGVECRKDSDVIDEIPQAYKDIDEVMRNQADLVKPIHELKQLLCIKG